MKRKYLAFDIETVKVMPVGQRDWKAQRPLGISCAATHVAGEREPSLWNGITRTGRVAIRLSRLEARGLVEFLEAQVRRGYTVLTWNGIGFDFDILAEESGMLDECVRLARGHVDMMFHVLCQVGYGVSLDSAARGMGIAGKPSGLSGANVPGLWAEGRRKEVLDYVAQDVRITLELARTCEACGCLRWITRAGKRREVLLPEGWLPVSSAERLPELDTRWMSKQWSRQAFTAWMQ